MNTSFVQKFSTKRLLCVLLIFYLIFPGAMAQTVSFAEPDTLTHKDMYLYNSNGTLLGVYNTTSSAINLTGLGDIFVVIKPQYATPLDDPGAWLASALSWTNSNATVLIFAFALVGVFLVRVK